MKYEWVEVFGMPKNGKIEDAEYWDMLRIPNQVFIKIEVI